MYLVILLSRLHCSHPWTFLSPRVGFLYSYRHEALSSPRPPYSQPHTSLSFHCGTSRSMINKFCFTEGALAILTSNSLDHIFICFCILYQSHSKSFSLAKIFLFLTSKAMHFFLLLTWYVPVLKYQASLIHVLLSHHNLFISTIRPLPLLLFFTFIKTLEWLP